RAARPPGRHRAARPGVRVHGPVRELRRPRGRLRRRRPRPARGAGVTAVQPGRLPRATATATGSLRTGARDTSHPAVQGPAVLSYYLVGGATLLLLALGVVMVLSASSITSIRATGSPYG